MRNEPSFAWLVKVLTIRFLICEGIASLLVSPCLDYANPSLLGSLGLLLLIYFVCLVGRRSRIKMKSDPGCLILLLMLPATFLVGVLAMLAYWAGLFPAWLHEKTWELFGVLVLLAPAIYHWNILERFYYQGPIACRLQSELGFTSDTNTLEGVWPMGEKYRYFQHVEPGKPMDQPGVRSQDILVEPQDSTEFFYLLEQARGGEPLTIKVVSWSDPEPVSRRSRRQVMIRVPLNSQG